MANDNRRSVQGFSTPGIWAAAALLTGLGALGASLAQPGGDSSFWRRRLIPLPKEFRVQGRRTLPASGVGLHVVGPADDIVTTAAAELHALFKKEGNGAKLTGRRFIILLGLCDPQGRLRGRPIPGAARLRGLRNSDQAYLIRPLDQNTLALAALDSKGLYYAVQTLRQLLDASFHDGKVTLPLASVTDWPDLAERGEWGGSANRDVVWMAHRKMNLVETHVHLGFDRNGQGTATLDEALIETGRRHALKVVPIIGHLDQLMRTGIFERFPELRGKGDHVSNARHTVLAPCCSQPKFTEILAEWMRALARHSGVTDIDVWLSEDPVFCSCPACRATGLDQHALEARCAVRAWKRVRREFPKLRLRLLLTQGSYAHNDQVLAQAPPEVGVIYYDGGRTYDSSRNPMIYPLLAEYAAQGRWLGCYPQIIPSWRIVSPWSAPQFIKFRMTEFVDKKLSCLCAYATPDNRLYDFNVNAAAEWSWNAHGRDERAFATAYFTRRNSPDPEAAADWAVRLGPVGWDVYGSRVPYTAFFGEAAAMIRRRRPAVLGKGMYRYFPEPGRLRRDLDVCKKAMKTAQRLGEQTLILETQVIQGYVEMLDALRELAAENAAVKAPAAKAQRAALQAQFNRLSAAGFRVTRGLDAWEKACGNGRRIGGRRLRDTIRVTEKTVTAVQRALARYGVTDPLAPYRLREIGKWETHDFDRQPTIRKEFEVTKVLTRPGTWRVTFQYTDGCWGLHIGRVALLRAPAGRPGKRVQVAEDKHPGNTGARSKGNVYTLIVPELKRGDRYFIIADVRGVSSVGKPENRRGCNGTVFLQARFRGNAAAGAPAPVPAQP